MFDALEKTNVHATSVRSITGWILFRLAEYKKVNCFLKQKLIVNAFVGSGLSQTFSISNQYWVKNQSQCGYGKWETFSLLLAGKETTITLRKRMSLFDLIVYRHALGLWYNRESNGQEEW